MALVKIGKAAEALGVSVQTLHAWEASGELIPDRKSAGGTRYYDLAKLLKLGNERAVLNAQPESVTTRIDRIIADLVALRAELSKKAGE